MNLIEPDGWIDKHLTNASAKELIAVLYDIFEVWDDLIDKDKHVADEDINRAFFNAFAVIPINGFYIQHFNRLYPHVVATMTAWETANVLHKLKSEESLAQAYTLRKIMINLVVECVRICNGDEAARKAAIAGWISSSRNDPYQTFIGE